MNSKAAEPGPGGDQTAGLGKANLRGFYSGLLGALSIALAILAWQLSTVRSPYSAHLLELAQKLGIVREPEAWSFPELSETTLLTVTDARAIAALGGLSLVLAVVALALALWAEHCKEDSLYLSVGFLCSVLALFVSHPAASFVVSVCGTALLLAIRRGCFLKRPG